MRCCACTVPQPVEPMRLVIFLHRNEVAFAPLTVSLQSPLLDPVWHPPNMQVDLG